MTSDAPVSLQKGRSKPPSFTSRQTTKGNELRPSGEQAHHPKTISRSCTQNSIAAGSAKHNRDLVTGRTPSPEDSPPAAQHQTINVILFGETGVGKSAVINLIAQKEIAKVSPDVDGCTMESTRYDIPFDDMNFAIFDTTGLEEPQIGVNYYLTAVEKAYDLIVKLGTAGGIHLLLFCIRGGRITATTRSNYRLFCECLCSTRVPIALVFTGLEREVEMEDWWTRNKTHIEYYGIKSDDHACITAVRNETSGGDIKYAESQRRIRELLKNCAFKNNAFSPEPQAWFAQIGRDMRRLIKKEMDPRRKDVLKVLMYRCKLDQEVAKKIADRMEKSYTDTNGRNPDNRAGVGWSDPELRADTKDKRRDPKENVANDDNPPTQGDGKQSGDSKPIFRSSTQKPVVAGSRVLCSGQTPPLGNSSLTVQPQTINVILFGETGVGKSAVINLISREEIAKVSSDIEGGTMASKCYDIPFDDVTFTIFDTIGLEQPRMGVIDYLTAIEKAHELIMKLSAAGGIHLLLFCMRGGRITATTQSNYRLFCECLCSTRVPIALVFTGLEREVEMEDWWTRNKTHIEHYGIKSDGHVCITAVKDDTPGEDLKYTESQRRIRELLKSCALKSSSFPPEPHTLFAKTGRDMRGFIERHRSPKKKDVVKVLTRRCKLDLETAKKIADMMEKSDRGEERV